MRPDIAGERGLPVSALDPVDMIALLKPRQFVRRHFEGHTVVVLLPSDHVMAVGARSIFWQASDLGAAAHIAFPPDLLCEITRGFTEYFVLFKRMRRVR